MPRLGEVGLVPGLGVAHYLRPAAIALADSGWRATILRPPSWPGRPRHPDDLATDLPRLGASVAGWLAARDRPVVLVGQSVGTQISAHAAAAAPDRVRLLVLQGPTVDPVHRSPARLAARWVANAPTERIRLGCSQALEWREVGVRRLAHLYLACLDDDLETTLRQVRSPVLVVVGAHDRLARRTWAAGLGTLPLRVLPGGHTALDRAPGAFADAVTSCAREAA